MSEIIDFQSARAAVARASEIGSDCELFSHRRPRPAPTTETGRNGQLRKDRVKAWINAERVTRYWRTRMDFEDALRSVQTNGLAVGRFHDEIGENRIMLVKEWRKALVEQMITPAPYVRAIMWKETTLAQGQHQHIGVKDQTLQRAIAADKAFLAAHPVRQIQEQAGAAMKRRRRLRKRNRQRLATHARRLRR
jgi:hypothetical protein